MPHSNKTTIREERDPNVNGFVTDSWGLEDNAEPPPVFTTTDFIRGVKEPRRSGRTQTNNVPQQSTRRKTEDDEDKADEKDEYGETEEQVDGASSRHSDELMSKSTAPGITDETRSAKEMKTLSRSLSCRDEEPTEKSPMSDRSSNENSITDQHSRTELWTKMSDPMKLKRANGTKYRSSSHHFSSNENISNLSQDMDCTKIDAGIEDQWDRSHISERSDDVSPHASPITRLPNWCARPKQFTEPVGMPKAKRLSDADTSEWKEGTKLHSSSRTDIEHRSDGDRLQNKNRLLSGQKHDLNRQQRKNLSRYSQSDGDPTSLFPGLHAFQSSPVGTNAEIRADPAGQNATYGEEAGMNQYRLGPLSGVQSDSKSHFGMLPLGANTLAAAAAAAMSPLFHNPVKDWPSHSADEHPQVSNLSSAGPFSAASVMSSALPNTSGSSSSSSKSMDTCFPPMLAAAAVAALTGGRFPTTGSGFASLNPMFSAPSNPSLYQAGSLGDVHSAIEFDRGSISVTGLMNNAPMSSADMAKELLFSPIRAMYQTSKSMFDPTGMSALGSCSRTGTTPPPPSLSASTSPRPMHTTRCPRGAVPSNSGDYCNSVDDGRDEVDENESVDGVDQCLDMEESVGTTNGHQWTFEEQFKQLYVLSDDPKRKEFLDELFAYMQRRGTPVNRIPIMAKQVLDLYELFQLVVARGGLVEVINKKLWREITKGLNLPSSITSAAFTLRTQYMKYLYPYECDTLGLSTPGELQAAIDGNRREARRSSYSFDYPITMPPGSGNRPGSPVYLMSSHVSNSALTASAINAAVAAAAMGQSLPNPNGPFPPNSLNGGTLPNGLHHLSNSTLSFGPGGLGFQSQLNQLHPLLGLPPVTLGGPNMSSLAHVTPATFAASQLSSSATSQSLFASTFMSSMSANNPFPMGGTSVFPPFSTGLGNSDDSLLESTPPPPHLLQSSQPQSQNAATMMTQPAVTQPPLPSSSSCLPPGGLDGTPITSFPDVNTMAAAAAAATLFGTGFPQLPGAFATSPPGEPRVLRTFKGHSGSETVCEQFSPNSNDTADCLSSSGQRRTQHSRHSNSEEVHSSSREQSPGPLNLVAAEDGLSNQGHRPADNMRTKHERNLSPDASNRLRSSGFISKKDDKKRPQSADQHLTRPTSVKKYTVDDLETIGDTKLNRMTNKNGAKSTFGGSASNGIRNSTQKTRPISVHGSSLSPTPMDADSDELMSKNTSQSACHQIWAAAAAAAAAAAGYQNLTNLEATSNNCDRPFDTLNQALNPNSQNEHSSHRQTSAPSQSTATSGKRPNVRGAGTFEGPSLKVPRTGNVVQSPTDSTSKRYSTNTTTGMSRKSGTSSSDYRRGMEGQTSSASNHHTSGNQNVNHLGVGGFALATQNLRIQTQSGGPMGLPQNAMVVTMEMGNLLYQGVLFGQFKR
ncbi:AT-rich interactive domain-containing protein 3A [Fasciola hepatica]|uniref:AT-rich interactive domain-containing protein 3A n=1 Tax=Fasciola hepatica TaxID=6192 RepID=A0A4E0R9X4_FASHE|nr:AT-rich interactive domain-containing protein 3A [Fasciola hepatica]